MYIMFDIDKIHIIFLKRYFYFSCTVFSNHYSLRQFYSNNCSVERMIILLYR